MGKQASTTPAMQPGIRWLYRLSGVAGLLVAIILLAGAIAAVAQGREPATTARGLAEIKDNWLILIFKLHAGFKGVDLASLQGLHLLDLDILVLVAIMYLGLYAALRRVSPIWTVVAAVQPFLGIALFVATKSAGRSAVMGAALVISLVMLAGQVFDKPVAYLGIVASILLLLGDFTAGLIPAPNILAVLVAVGYVLLIAWFGLVARGLFRLAEGAG